MVWFPGWTRTPIPDLSFSASGLLALADLSTIAQRTAITGGSRWLDSLILAPGLHYQQAADELVKSATSAIIDAVEDRGGKPTTLTIHNAATANYIRKIAKPGETVTLDVGSLPVGRGRYRLRRSESGMHATVWAEQMPDLGWLSHLLYLASPILTVVAVVFNVLLQDWWALGLLCALMLSRVMNIWVIKQRSKPIPHPSPSLPYPDGDPTKGPYDGMPGMPNTTITATAKDSSYADPLDPAANRTEIRIRVGDGKAHVLMRGSPEDLRAITADSWLRAKTHLDGYLEAAAKLLVYMVAALSGNMTQAGQIVQAALLLTTAGLLALSNAHAQSFQMNGRVAAPTSGDPGKGGDAGAGAGAGGAGTGTDGAVGTGPAVPSPEKWDPEAQYPYPGSDGAGGGYSYSRGRRGRQHHKVQDDDDDWNDRIDDDKDQKHTDSWPTASTTTESGEMEEGYLYGHQGQGGILGTQPPVEQWIPQQQNLPRRSSQQQQQQHEQHHRQQRQNSRRGRHPSQSQSGGSRSGSRRGGSRGREEGRYDTRLDDWAERGQIKHVRDPYPFDDSVHYN